MLVITDRKELLTQAGGTFEKFGMKADYLTAATKKLPDQQRLFVAMVETIKRRLSKPDYIEFMQNFSLIIIDEAHKQSFDRLFETITPFQYVIGATATPYRIGKMTPLSKHYDSIIIGNQINELIADGYLSPAMHYGVPIAGLNKVKITAGEFDAKETGKLYDDQVLYTGAVSNWKKYAHGRKTLLFASTVKNSMRMAQSFNSAGVSAMHLDAETPKEERENILSDFSAGKFDVLCNVGILTTGYDEPGVSCIITYRPTRSLPLWLQMCGRGSRIAPGKKDFIILDFGENTKRHGFWDASRHWSLENAKPPKKTGVAPIKECKNCGAFIPANASVCPFCGYEYPKEVKPKTEVEVMLEQMTPTQINSADWDVYEMEQVRLARGYKPGWVLHRLRTYERFQQYAKLKGYKKGWVYHNYRAYGEVRNYGR